jgi:FixJ family two-component response regulator
MFAVLRHYLCVGFFYYRSQIVELEAKFVELEAKLSKIPMIAIVDDDDSFRNATMSFIRSLGYAVVQFASADAFLKSNRLHDTDCLISDVQMPGMNWVELQGKLIAQGHHLPIIFLTAFPEIKARAQALAAGATGFLAKPFNDEMLIRCLNEALVVGFRNYEQHADLGVPEQVTH